ncbi:hypothetical protein Brsp04_03488 [Brucella sp. NBRC 12952]
MISATLMGSSTVKVEDHKGDRGFALSSAELETMVRVEIPVTVIVLNDGILGFQKDAETVKFNRYTTLAIFQ